MIISGIITEPIEAVSATDEPEMQPNRVEATMLTSARPPRIQPTKTRARFTKRRAMPPSAMIAPASTKKGMASSEKLSTPSEILSMTASRGMSIHSAATSAERPSEYATGTPIAQRTVNTASRMRMSTRYSRSCGWSLYMIEVRGGSPHQTRSTMKSTVIRPPTGIGR